MDTATHSHSGSGKEDLLQNVSDLLAQPVGHTSSARAWNRQRIRNHIAGCDAEISRIFTLFERTQNTREALVKHLESLVALDTHIDSLPDDVLRLIMHIIVEGEYPLADMPTSRVCQRWRRICHSSPTLFTRITVNVWSAPSDDEDALDEHPQTPALAVQEYLTRSHYLPLNIIFRHCGDGFVRAPMLPFDPPALRHLAEHSERWQEARMFLSGSAKSSPSFVIMKGRLPLLRKLGVYDVNGESDVAEDVPLCFYGCPNLEELTLDDGMLPNVPALESNPWPRLKVVHLSSVDLPQVLEFLPHVCMTLESLVLTRCFNDMLEDHVPISSEHPPIILGSLQSIGFETFDIVGIPAAQHIAVFLDRLTCPKLTKLEVTFEESDRSLARLHIGQLSSSIPAFIARSSCILHSMVLSVGATGQELVDFFHHIPDLRVLKLYNVWSIRIEGDAGMGSFLHALSQPTSDEMAPSLLPELKECHFVLSHELWGTWEGGVNARRRVVDAFDARTRCPNSRLQTIILGMDMNSIAWFDMRQESCPAYSEELNEQLARMKAATNVELDFRVGFESSSPWVLHGPRI